MTPIQALIVLIPITFSATASNELLVAKELNDYFNRFEYRSDAQLFGVNDYWQSPSEFALIESGDCEDFAISKYFKLKETLPDSDPILHYVDTNLGAHMVTSAMVDGVRYVFDNVSRELIPIADRTDLRFAYSFNDTELWLGEAQRGRSYPLNIERFKKILDKQMNAI